jgi:uncharacterized protein (DUF488 family)
LLGQHEVTALADVRSQAYSRFASQFDSGLLEMSCNVAAVRYLRMGDGLGGRPRRRDLYDLQGRVIYSKVAETSAFRESLSEVVKVAKRERLVIMCAEEDPHDCHRRLLIGHELSRCGVEMLHIRADGRVQTEADLRATETAVVQKQLFGEDSGWKSIRSVSPGARPRISSDS